MSQKELREKAALLKDGQIVEIAGDWFRAVKMDQTYTGSPCVLCELDSICHDDVFDVCSEMDTIESRYWYLKLAHP